MSNAADACDKRRFLSITDNDASHVDHPEIKIKCNADDNTVIIEDSGVGMTRDELVNNLGAIAKSGTKAFVEALGEGSQDAVNLIGQFGVGFYSSYLVADKVEVITKSMQEGSPQLKWTSKADSSYTIEPDDSGEPIEGSGTRLVLHLKEDTSEYLDTAKIEELLNRYSEFIEFPISIWKETTEYKQVPDEEANKDLKEGEEPKMKTVPETTEGWERVNNQKPIWLRPPKEVKDEEYTDFYKSAFRASYDEPLRHSHFVLEGQVECKALLFIPGMLPFELSKDMFDENARNIRLYVKRVFINDQFEELMPRWLKFIRGVIDSDDLPLNVSREILQKSKVLSIINKRLIRKSLDMMHDIANDEDPSKYSKCRFVILCMQSLNVPFEYSPIPPLVPSQSCSGTTLASILKSALSRTIGTERILPRCYDSSRAGRAKSTRRWTSTWRACPRAKRTFTLLLEMVERTLPCRPSLKS